MASDNEIVDDFFRKVNQDKDAKRRLADAIRRRDESALYKVVRSIASAIWGATKTVASAVVQAVVGVIVWDW